MTVRQLTRLAQSIDCACGGLKEPEAKTCRACFEAYRVSARQARMIPPSPCGCGHAAFPSPWHCGCGRWKASTAAVCETCMEAARNAAA